MQNNETIKHPIIEVSINGDTVADYPSKFTLITQTGFPLVHAELLYPADSNAGKTGDAITVSLVYEAEDKTDRYFTGVIYSAATHNKHRTLLLADGYKKLCETSFAAAYRKEKAASILDDILAESRITESKTACPDVELARFSTQTIPARLCMDLLIDALKEHGETGLVYFFDENDAFHFGTAEDAGKNEGEPETFETGKNIVKAGPGWIEVLPRPIRHSREITVDKKTLVTVRTDLAVSRSHSRLRLYVREA